MLIHSSSPLIPLDHVIFLIVENVELTSNKKTRFTCPGQEVNFTCCVIGSSFLKWKNPLIRQIIYTANSPTSDITVRGPFIASLISVSGKNTPLNANFTSTLQVTASRMIMRDATTVTCLSASDSKTDNFTVAGKEWTLVVRRYCLMALMY